MDSSVAEITLPATLSAALDLVLQFDTVDSTNAEALRRLQSGNLGTSLLIANSQTAGRGRRGRQWLSPAGGGIYLTLLRPFAHKPGGLQSLSLVTALSVRDALASSGIDSVCIKWPNDLLVDGKKLGGILLELKQQNNRNYVAFGIGINLSIPAPIAQQILQPTTDLQSLMRSSPDKSEIVSRLLEKLLANLLIFEQSGFNSFRDDWNRYDLYFEKDIELRLGDRRLTGRSKGVDNDGNLLVQTANGLETLSGGEIFPSLRAAQSKDFL